MLLSDDVCLTSVVAYIGPNSRSERPMKIKIGTEVAHVTCGAFKVRRSKVNLFDRQKGIAYANSTMLCFDSVGTNLVKLHSAYF